MTMTSWGYTIKANVNIYTEDDCVIVVQETAIFNPSVTRSFGERSRAFRLHDVNIVHRTCKRCTEITYQDKSFKVLGAFIELTEILADLYIQ